MMNYLRTRKKIAALAILLILVLCVTAGRPVVVATASDSTVTQVFTAAARSFAEQAEGARGHHLTEDPVITVMSKQIQAGKMEVIMDIDEMSVLNSGPRDAEPVLAGKLQYLQDRGAALSAAARKAVDDDIADWRSTIESAMSIPTESHDIIKVVADADLAGMVDADTLQVYVDEGVVGSRYISAAQSFKNMRSAWVTVAQAYGSSASIAADTSTKDSSTPAGTLSSYNRTTAYQYADRWVKNTTIMCSSDTYQDTQNWNTTQYPDYQYSNCNDCADFVSQCLHAGGIPTTSTWCYLYSGLHPAAWFTVGSLKNYLLSNGYVTYDIPRLRAIHRIALRLLLNGYQRRCFS
jgi:hypothetical protein